MTDLKPVEGIVEPFAPKKPVEIFVGLPSMCERNDALTARLLQWTQDARYRLWLHILTEKRHHDFARNMLCESFLESPCQWMLMLDADVEPHPNLLKLVTYGKDIIAGNVNCWINGHLMSSIWQLAECEECRVTKIFLETGKIHDPSQYRIGSEKNTLLRWNPFTNAWNALILRGERNHRCRCKGTGFDPWVFKTHQSLIGNQEALKVDSVGAAALLIHRRVLEKTERPWFSFLYKPSREILLTEDHYFCWKAQMSGFEVWADPNLPCSHFKAVNLLEVHNALNEAVIAGMKHQKNIDDAKSSIVIPSPEEIAAVER